MILKGSRTSIAKKTYILRLSGLGVRSPCSPPPSVSSHVIIKEIAVGLLGDCQCGWFLRLFISSYSVKQNPHFLPEIGFVYVCEVCDSSVGSTCVKTDWQCLVRVVVLSFETLGIILQSTAWCHKRVPFESFRRDLM